MQHVSSFNTGLVQVIEIGDEMYLLCLWSFQFSDESETWLPVLSVPCFVPFLRRFFRLLQPSRYSCKDAQDPTVTQSLNLEGPNSAIDCKTKQNILQSYCGIKTGLDPLKEKNINPSTPSGNLSRPKCQPPCQVTMAAGRSVEFSSIFLVFGTLCRVAMNVK